MLSSHSFANKSENIADLIAVVNVQLVMKESIATKDLNEQVKRIQKKDREEITKQEEALRKEDKNLAEQRNILSKEAFTKKEKAFKQKLISVQRDIQEKRSDLDSSFKSSITVIQNKIYKIIEEIAKKKKFKVALPVSQTLYIEESLDITADVLEVLNKELPKVKLEIKK